MINSLKHLAINNYMWCVSRWELCIQSEVTQMEEDIYGKNREHTIQ